MAKRIGVVLTGCGHLDGAEVQESVLTLFFLERAGFEVACFAPDKPQLHVINHLTREPTGEARNVLVESARIARGEIQPLSRATMSTLDGLALPGGFGAAKNLSDFASKGVDASVDPDLLRLVKEAVTAKKPILAVCISPAVLAVALKQLGVEATLTVGEGGNAAEAIEALGSHHAACPVFRSVVDEAHRIISTPAYMYDASPKGVGAGIEEGVKTLKEWLLPG